MDKECKTCKLTKSIDKFGSRGNGHVSLHCKDCMNTKAKTWRKANPSKWKYNRTRNAKSRYGLSKEAYEKLVEDSNGMCAICGIKDKDLKGTLHIDHDHNTGEVRGMLCHGCNVGLGHFNDDVDLMSKAIKYLQKEYG